MVHLLTEAKDAAAFGYDCVYSTSTEEYVILKPEFALPEFVMQVQMMPSEELHAQSAPRRSEKERRDKKQEGELTGEKPPGTPRR